MKKEDFLKKLKEIDEMDIGGTDYVKEVLKAARDTELSEDEWVYVAGYITSYMCPDCDNPIREFGDYCDLIEALQD